MKGLRLTIWLSLLSLSPAGAAEPAEEPAAVVEEMSALTGIITDPRPPLGRIECDGEEWIIHLGPLWFWEASDFHLEEGEELEVIGEMEIVKGVRHIYPNELRLENRRIELASESGIPHWTRGARERGRGEGRHGEGHGGGRHSGRKGSGNQWGHR